MSADSAMIALVRKVRDQLEFYGDNHLAKTPPQHEKAKANYDLVHEINDALLALAVPPRMLDPELVRVPDVFEPASIIYREPDASHIPSLVHLTKFVETLAPRDDEDYVALRLRLGDLRTLAGVDGG
jgi:hypothetical protein